MNQYSPYSQYSRVIGHFMMPSPIPNPRIPNTTNTDFIRGIRRIQIIGEKLEKSIKTVFAVFSIHGLGEDHDLLNTSPNPEYHEYSEYGQPRPRPQKKTAYARFYCEQCSKTFIAPEDKTFNASKCRACGTECQRTYINAEFERRWGWTHSQYSGGKDGHFTPSGTPRERERRRKRFPGFFK